MDQNIELLKYPIGKHVPALSFSGEDVEKAIVNTERFPALLKKEVNGLIETQLNTPYRPGGWTVRQVVHHCADSHMNALIRFKLGLTEDKPVIKPYPEALWAELPDYRMPVDSSLMILEGVHAHLALIWRSMTREDLNKMYIHPQYNKSFTLAEAMSLYDWHGRHHLAHITSLKQRNGW